MGLDLPEFNMAGQEPNNDELNTVFSRLNVRILFDFAIEHLSIVRNYFCPRLANFSGFTRLLGNSRADI